MTAEHSAVSRPLPQTPPEAITSTVRDAVIVEGHTFLITHPGDSDLLLDNPAVRAAFAADGYLPYWADLWPAARMLAKVLLREPLTAGATALEAAK